MDRLRFRVREARASIRPEGGRPATQEAFAALLGVTRSAVANWEAGVGVPDMQNLIRIAQISGMSFEYLATGRGPSRMEGGGVGEDLVTYPKEDAAHSGDEVLLLKRFRASSAEKRKAILVLLK